MKVSLGTIEVSDHDRRAIRRFYGGRGLATRKDVRDWITIEAMAALEELAAIPND